MSEYWNYIFRIKKEKIEGLNNLSHAELSYQYLYLFQDFIDTEIIVVVDGNKDWHRRYRNDVEFDKNLILRSELLKILGLVV